MCGFEVDDGAAQLIELAGLFEIEEFAHRVRRHP